MMHGDHDFDDCTCEPDDLENEAAPATPFSWRNVATDWLNAVGGMGELVAEFPYSIARALAGHQRHVEKRREFTEQAAHEIERMTSG